jgi:hypothetical protein
VRRLRRRPRTVLVDEGALRRLLGLRSGDPLPPSPSAALLVLGAAYQVVLDEEIHWLNLDDAIGETT